MNEPKDSQTIEDQEMDDEYLIDNDDNDDNEYNEEADDGTLASLIPKNKQMKRTYSGTKTIASHNNTRMTSKSDKIPPVVFFKVGSEMSDQRLLNRHISEKTTGVNIINVRFSNNGNVSIYTKSEEDNLKFENNEDLFSGSSRLNLQTIDRVPCLMIKNITHEYAMENEQSLKEKYDVY